MLETFRDVGAFSQFMSDLWSVLPPFLQSMITAMFAVFIVFGMLKLID